MASRAIQGSRGISAFQRFGRGLLAAAALVLVAAAEPETAPDHDDALKARARGEIKPLEQILQALKVHRTDRLVDVGINKRDGRWIYEVTWITKTGRFHIFTVDAAQAIILKDEIK
jgi:uncharacterized membrane protein YkoI